MYVTLWHNFFATHLLYPEACPLSEEVQSDQVQAAGSIDLKHKQKKANLYFYVFDTVMA